MSEPDKKERNSLIAFILVSIFIAAAFVIGILYTAVFYPKLIDVAINLGPAGDFVGGLGNPLLAFLSLVALLITVWNQMKEMRLSREELELTKEELAKSATAQEKQSNHLESEAIKADYYRLIEKIAARIEANMALQVIRNPKCSLKRIIEEGSGLDSNNLLIELNNAYLNSEILTVSLVDYLVRDLTLLKKYVSEYEKASYESREDVPFREFYTNEYKPLVNILLSIQNLVIPAETKEYYMRA